MSAFQGQEYYQSYEDLDVHKLMLQDSVRNQAYRQAILDNRDALNGKVVMDVGAGTGILSVYCAQAGASKVYAIEASETYKIAKEIVKENAFENVIEVINKRVEDLSLPEDVKVDAIVSEWMGFYLLHEGMLDSVIAARDKFLKPDGIMFPFSATLYAAPCSVPEMHEFWDDLNGVSMKSFAKHLRSGASQKPETNTVHPDCLIAVPESFFWFDLKEVTLTEIENVSFRNIFVSTKSAMYQGICIWFTCTFPSHMTEPIILSTDPEDASTHWKQTTVVFPEEVIVEQGEPIGVEIVLSRNRAVRRRYDIEVTMLDPTEVEHPEYCNCHMTKCILAKAVLAKYENNEFNT